MSKAERETIIRWDCEDRTPVLYTADPAQAKRWTKLGYAVSVFGSHLDGAPRGWAAKGVAGCVRFRRLQDGALVKRANGARNLAVHQQILQGRRAEAAGSLTGSGRQRTP